MDQSVGGSKNCVTARQAALELYDKHKWFVFPADPKKKKPYYPFRWKPLGDHLPDRDVVDSWPEWDKLGCRVAARTGAISGIVVLDCDSDHAKAFVNSRGVPPGPMASTGSGIHYYYKYPGRRVKTVAHFGGIEDLDIRGDGGIVMVPPSIHESGKQYEWIIRPDEEDLPDCPKWLLDMFDKEEKEIKPLDMHEVYQGVSEGKRDDTLFRAAAKMRRADFDKDHAYVSIEEFNKQACKPPLNNAEARAKVTWVWSNYEAGAPDVVLDVNKEIERQKDESPQLKTFSDVELMSWKFERTRWAVPGILPEGTMILGGRPKTGKSFYAFDMCVGVADGSYVLGSVSVDRGEVLYLALEDNRRRLQRRRKQLRPDTGPLPNLHYADFAGRVDTDLLGQIDTWLLEHEDTAKLVVIDTFAKVKSRKGGGKNANIYDEDYQNVEALTQIAGKYGVAILLITHLNQSRDISDPLELITGSSGFTGGVDGAMVLLRGRDDDTGFLKAYHRDMEEDLDIAIARQENGSWHHMGDAETFRLSKEKREILDILHNADDLLSPKEVTELIGRSDVKTNNVNKRMLKMVGEGTLISPYPGKYKVSVTAPTVKGGELHVGPVSHEPVKDKEEVEEEAEQEELGEWF